MIVRQRKFEIPRHYLYNAGVAGFLLLTGVMAFRSTYTKDETPLCEVRYETGVLFSLAKRNGAPLTPEDLQSRLSGRDWGLVENTRIKAVDGAPSGFALEIDLKRPAAKADDQNANKSGMGFTWLPRALDTATSACLSYSVWTPADFPFGEGGLLPTLNGDVPESYGNVEGANIKPFSAHVVWRSDKSLHVVPNVNAGDRKAAIQAEPGAAVLTPGKWVRIEQEVVLNTPGKPDGAFRLWVDGKLKIERYDIGYRNSDKQRLVSVNAATHFSKGYYGWAPAPKDTRILLSPMELRVR